MELLTKRETLIRGKGVNYCVYLKGRMIGHGPTKEAAQEAAKQALSDAFEYISLSCVTRVALDGTILVFRMLSADICMYEHCRDGRGGSSCMGKMTDGMQTFRTMAEYADYVVGQYNG